MGDPATVYLSSGCSGTLVSPKTVLTAKHCLANGIKVYFGTYANQNGSGTWINTVHRLGHSTADIAMLTLASAGAPTPIPLNKLDLSTVLNQQIRIAGFGVTSENGSNSGTKRVGVASLMSVEGGIMYATNMPSGTCYGDSGGPNFMTIAGKEYIIGVTSFGTAACGSGLDGSVRVDTYLAWIKQYIQDHDVLPPEATCAGDGLCASDCTSVDPDCPCADDGFCTAACGDVGSDPDCTGCLAGDVCRADCPALDTDCCAADGLCNDACGLTDADCVPPDNGNNEEEDGKGGDSGGCTTSGDASWLFAFALGLLLLARRRR
jgi:MYXO-CTERM domain-containing protein